MWGGDLTLWSRVTDAADFYRRLAKRYGSVSYKGTILGLAASVLEDLGEDIVNGYIRRNTDEKVKFVLKLLRRNSLPYYTLERLYIEASKRYSKRLSFLEERISASWEASVGLV